MGDDGNLIDELRRRSRGGDEPPARGATNPRRWRESEGEGESAEPPAGEEAGDAEVNTAAFGYYRGVRERAAYLEFQLLKGPSYAAGYAWLPCPRWHPSGDGRGRGQAITLEYVTGLKVTVRGRNLRPLYERLLRLQAFRVSEMGEEADRYLPEQATVVYAVEVAEGPARLV